MVATRTRWTRWFQGKRYNVRMAASDFEGQTYHYFPVRVEIHDKKTGKTLKRVGRCHYVNKDVYPIDVRLGNKTHNLGRLLHVE